MPVYNASKFLKEAIDSILAQTFKDFELIVINDGSSDDSEKIIHSYQDTRIVYAYQENQGVASTLNAGIELATQKYIWRHDADDISLPNKLEKEIAFLEANPEYGLCATQVAFMSENSKVAFNFRMPHNSVFEGQSFLLVERKHFNPYCPITHGTVLVRTDLMRRLNGYRKEFITSEDIDAWLRLIQISKAAVLNEVLSFHRISSKSATQIHGWKNEYLKHVAFKYYDQRQQFGKDDLQNGILLTLPDKNPSIDEAIKPTEFGKNFRSDIIYYLIPLYLDAKDWHLVFISLYGYIREGWKLTLTWKHLFLFSVGEKAAKILVAIKKSFPW